MATEENQATDDANTMVSTESGGAANSSEGVVNGAVVDSGASNDSVDNDDGVAAAASEAATNVSPAEVSTETTTPEAPSAVEAAPVVAEAPVEAAPAEAPTEAALADAAPADAAPAEAAPTEAAPADAPADAAPADAAPTDAATDAATHAAPADAAPAEAESAEAAAPADDATSGGGEGASAEAQADGASGDGKKKRRRRRRRKKKGDGESVAPEDGTAPRASQAGAAAPSGAGPEKPRPAPRKKRPAERDRPAFNLGDEIFGRVSKVTKDAIWLDVAGGKAIGIYDRKELIQIPPKEGEQFIAKVKSLSLRGGVMMLGRELFDTTQTRAELRAALQTGNPLDCWVTGVIKGGLEVDYKGVRCFAPASHVEVKSNADLSPYLGELMPFVVTQYGKKGRDVVVSRKSMMEEEYNKSRDEHLAKLEPDMEVKAVVRTVLQWGAFVSLPEYGDVEGVVHMSEASHDRSARLDEVFKVGGEISVKVLKVDEKKKLWLSHKATLDDPWEAAKEKYAVGTVLTRKVVRITDFGAFIQLEPGIDGLCHVADLSFTVVKHPSDVVEVGQDFEVVVAALDSKTKKVTLHPAPPEDEKDVPPIKRLAPQQQVDVVVMQIKENGLGVRIVGATGRRARGYIHAGQTGTPRGTDLRKSFPLGHRMQAKVIDIDRRGEVKLSIRALKEDAEKAAYRDYRKKVQRESSFGTFADLLKGKI